MKIEDWFYILSGFGVLLLLYNLITKSSSRLSLLSFLLIAAAFFVLPAAQFQEKSGVNSNTFPFFISLALLICLSFTIFESKPDARLAGTRFVLLIILLTATYLFLAQVLGYYSSSLVYLAGAAILLGSKNYLTLFCTILSWGFFVYFIFEQTLSISMPQGFLF